MNLMILRVSQVKPVTADHYVIMRWRTVDHVGAYFKAVCSTMQNHVIALCILWGRHSKMKIHHQNGWSLPHQAETQGNYVTKKTTALFALSRGASLKWCLLREEKRLFSRAIRAVIYTHFCNSSYNPGQTCWDNSIYFLTFAPYSRLP